MLILGLANILVGDVLWRQQENTRVDEKKPKKFQGGAREGAGRPKGVPNKSTTHAREAIARLVDGNSERLGEWLERIAESDPKGAFTCLMNVMEYHLPRLQRSELQALDANGDKSDGFVVMVNHVKPNAKTD